MFTTTRHGHNRRGERSPTYSSWNAMIQRCTNPNHICYPRYGGRRIVVCERWRIFKNFLEDMGERPNTEYCIDRINNDGNYLLENCRWVIKSENVRKDHPKRRLKL